MPVKLLKVSKISKRLNRIWMPLVAIPITISVAVAVCIGWIVYELGRDDLK